MKHILSVEEQIEHMKRKGITFDYTTEDEAKVFLAQNNYYMKLAAYRENYRKCEEGRRYGQYVDLDFAYLKELSTIDMHLRYLVMEMCLDLEHAIKVKLVRDVTQQPGEDGYQIVKDFLSTNERVRKQVESHKASYYCHDLIEKYEPDFPIWVFVEVISFGTLLHLCHFYRDKYGIKIVDHKLMNTIRDLRNASAHSNCLMNNLYRRLDTTKQVSSEVVQWVKSMEGISKNSRTNNLKSAFVHDMVVLLYVYEQLMTTTPKQKRYQQLADFLHGRVVRHKDYFVSNTKICGVYHFLEKVVDNLNKKTYNNSTIEKQ